MKRHSVKKYLNSRYNKVYTSKYRVSNTRANIYQYSGEGAQMLIMAAILVAVTVISLSVYVSELSNITVTLPVEESSELFPVFDNIREKFGHALEDLITEDTSSYSWICDSVNSTSEAFFVVESQHMRYFDADLVDVDFFSGYIGITVSLKLYDEKCMISEEVIYEINL